MSAPIGPAAPDGAATIRVWDLLVRLVHWTVAGACLLDLFVLEEGSKAHEIAGYVALGAMIVRVIWGFIGPRHARFSDFVRGPGEIAFYLRANFGGHPPRYIGHNPAAAVMMLALMALVLGVGITGHMMGTDMFWGESWVEELHESLANAILVLALLHALAAIVESWRHRENLVLAMITGRKKA